MLCNMLYCTISEVLALALGGSICINYLSNVFIVVTNSHCAQLYPRYHCSRNYGYGVKKTKFCSCEADFQVEYMTKQTSESMNKSIRQDKKCQVIQQVSDCLSVIHRPLGVSETFTGGLGGHDYFHKSIKMLFAFVTLILSSVYSGIFQSLCDVMMSLLWQVMECW